MAVGRHHLGNRTDHRQPARALELRGGGIARADLREAEGRADTATDPRQQHERQEQRPVRRRGAGRLRRRIEQFDLDRVGFGLRIAAQPHLLALGEQLVILRLGRGIFAVDPVIFGGDAGVLDLLRGDARDVAHQLRLARGQRADRRLTLGAHRGERGIGGILHPAAATAAAFAVGDGLQRRDLALQRDDIGMRIGEPARAHRGKFVLRPGKLLARDAAAHAAAGAGDRLRGRGKLAVRGCKLRLRRDELAVDLAEFGARRLDALRGRAGAARDQADILRLERRAARLDLAQALFAVGDLRIEEFQTLARVDAATAQLIVAEHGDQAIEYSARELRIVGVGQAADPDRRGQLEDILLLRHDLDILLQHRDRARLVALAGFGADQPGGRRDLFEVARAGQRLADLVDLLPAPERTAGAIVGQDLVDLDEQPRAAVIAVGDRRDRKPAEDADAPGDREHEPAARPDAVHRHPDFVVKAVHRSLSVLGNHVGGGKDQNMLSGMMITSPGCKRTFALMSPRLMRSLRRSPNSSCLPVPLS